MRITELAQQGIARIHKKMWANPQDYLELHLMQGKDGDWFYGPWATLYANGREEPLQILVLANDADDWEPWQPPEER